MSELEGTTSKPVFVDSVFDIEQWKAGILKRVVDAFASQNQGDIQKSISMWRWSDALPFPSANDINVNGGSLTFEVLVAEEPVFFSLWYMLGEVRIGIRVPEKLIGASSGIPSSAFKDISTAYDGSVCQRIVSSKDGRFFDWIFKDGFASFETATKAMKDRELEIAIASRLADILIHLYMATLNIFIENRGFKVMFKKIEHPGSLKTFVIKVRGDKDAFRYWIKGFGEIEKEMKADFPPANEYSHFIISTKEGVNIPTGDVCVDGARFSVVDVFGRN